ncbi:condensation domain-containing protein, partial [Pseudoalteromonas ruthenica]
DQIESGNSHYNICEAFRFEGLLDVSILNDCLNDIIRRHDIFRTVYLNDGDEPYQSVLEHDVFTMSEIDLS